MSDRVMPPVHDANKKRKQTPKPYQSVWFAHWKQTSCDAAGETTSHKELDYVTRNDLEDSSRSFSGLNMVKTTTFDIGNDVINISSKSVGNERMLGSLFKNGQDSDDMQTSRMEFAHNLERGKAVDSKSGVQFHPLIPSQGIHSGEHTSNNPPKWIRTHTTRKDSIIGLNPLQETFVESSSYIVPYGFNIGKYAFDKGKATVSVASKQSRTAKRVHEHNESITGDHYLSTFGWDRFPKTHECSGIRVFPSQCISSEESETRKSRNDYYYLLKMQNGVHSVETMRICTTMDALGGPPEGCPRSSPTTKLTDVNKFTKNDMFRNRRVITKINGNISSEFHCLSPFPGQSQQQVKLQPLSGLIDSEVKGKKKTNVKAFKVTIRNESSAQTDTMDMDSFEENSKKNLHSGSNSTTSSKANNLESYVPPLTQVASAREVAHGLLNNKPLQNNLELPALPCAATSSENTCPSFSKTMEMEKLLEHPKPKSNFNLNEFPNADPGNRWVKRLKLSSSNSFAQGMKSSNFASSPSHEKTSKLFSRIPKSGTTISAPKSLLQSDKNADFSKKDEDSLKENPEDNGNALILSHDWIKRWLPNGRGTGEKNPETDAVCEPQNSKLSMEKLQKEQLPSIAAMALMAKVLTCFQPCEFRKMGPFTVWNTKTF